LKEILGDHQTRDRLWLAPADQLGFTVAEERVIASDLLEGLIVPLKLFVCAHSVGDDRKPALTPAALQPRELLRVRERKWTQHNGIYDAEYGNVGANADGQNEHGNNGKPPVPTARPKGVTQILQQDIQGWQSSRVSMLLLGLACSAESKQRLSAGLLGRQAAPEIFFDGQIQMSLNFGIDLTIHLIGSENRPQAAKRS
jgi:hypothetical protein